MKETSEEKELQSAVEESERIYVLFSDAREEISQLLISHQVEYTESSIAVLSNNSPDKEVITVISSACKFLQFISDALARRKVVVHVRDGNVYRNIELHGYSKQEALEILNKVNDIYISKEDT